MLKLVKYYFVLFFISLILFMGCKNYKKAQVEEYTIVFENYSRNIVGDSVYYKVFQNLNDSIENWEKKGIQGYRIATEPWEIDSLLCFNETGNKFVGVFKYQYVSKKANGDGIYIVYGAKVKNAWYFFNGASFYLPRTYYQKDNQIPLSFTKLHEIAMNEVFNGYLKKNDKEDWEINNSFFKVFEASNWVNFGERKTNGNRFCSCEEIENLNDYLECNYRKNAESIWVKEKWYLKKNAPVYETINPIKVRWKLEKGRRLKVLEYIDGGEWCKVMVTGICPDGNYDTNISYARMKDLTPNMNTY